MSASVKDPLNLDTLDLDDPAESMAFYRALSEPGRHQVAEQLRRLYDRGIVDAFGRLVSEEIPAEVLDPEATVEQL